MPSSVAIRFIRTRRAEDSKGADRKLVPTQRANPTAARRTNISSLCTLLYPAKETKKTAHVGYADATQMLAGFIYYLRYRVTPCTVPLPQTHKQNFHSFTSTALRYVDLAILQPPRVSPLRDSMDRSTSGTGCMVRVGMSPFAILLLNSQMRRDKPSDLRCECSHIGPGTLVALFSSVVRHQLDNRARTCSTVELVTCTASSTLGRAFH